MPRLVLIVEDSKDCAETLQIALESLPDLTVRVIENPVDALTALQQCPGEVAAILTDLHMPQSDGLQLIRQLRAEARFATVPILLISGDSNPLLPVRALADGANAFFPKPYSPAAVRKKLEELLC